MKAASFSADVQDFVRALADHGVRFLMVGGQAVVYHGYPRFTKDLDLFYAREPDDAARLYAALRDFWGGPIPHVPDAAALMEPGIFVQFGVPPSRIDLISVMGSVDFEQAWSRRVTEQLEGDGWTAMMPVLSREDLMLAKAQAGRPQDLADIAALGAVWREESGKS